MKTVVFVSRDDAEYACYCRGCGTGCNSEAFFRKVGESVVYVVKSFREKEDCVVRHFDPDALSGFLGKLAEKLNKAKPLECNKNQMLPDDFYLFVHWGGGSWVNWEKVVRSGLSDCQSWNDCSGRAHRAAFAISSKRSLFDVQVDPICLPQKENDLNALIRRAEYEVLSEFWTRSAVFGKICCADLEKTGMNVQDVENYLKEMEERVLVSHLPLGKKDRRLKAIRKLYDALTKSELKKRPEKMKVAERKFLHDLLNEGVEYA